MNNTDSHNIFDVYADRTVTGSKKRDDLIVHIIMHYNSEGMPVNPDIRPHFIASEDRDRMVTKFERQSKDPEIFRDLEISQGISTKVESYWITPGLYIEMTNTLSGEKEGHYFVNARQYMDWRKYGHESIHDRDLNDKHILKWIAEIDYKK
jgi:hypothetical protein